MKLLTILASALASLVLFVPASMGDEKSDGRQERSETHLNVPSKQIVHLSTHCVRNDNRADNGYYYDGNPDAPFAPKGVPKGYSFVITDIVIQPFCNTTPNKNDSYFVVIAMGGGARQFQALNFEGGTKHYALAGGLVVPEGYSISARNHDTSTATQVIVELFGYFVKGKGLDLGVPFTPEDQ
jgi:hypothetical protein